MEAVGLLLGVIGIAKTCMQAYEIVADARHAGPELNQLVSRLYVEQAKFLLWYVGFASVIRLQNATLPAQDLSDEAAARVNSRLQARIVLHSIQSTLKSILETFEESKDLLNTYTVRKPERTLTRVVSQVGIATSTIAVGDLLWDDEQDRQRSKAVQETSFFKKKFKAVGWALGDKKKFTDMITKLVQRNNNLNELLEAGERIALKRSMDQLATTTPLGASVSSASFLRVLHVQAPNSSRAALPAPQEQNEDSDNDSMRQLVQLRQRGFAIEEEGDGNTSERASTFAQPAHPGAEIAGLDNLRIAQSDLTFPLGENSASKRRTHAHYNKTQPVVVEIRHYSSRIKPQQLETLKRRVALLTQSLRQSSRLTDFSILDCIGYLEDERNSRFGIAFSYPKNDKNQSVFSLRDRMNEDRSKQVGRDLDARLEVASVLARTFWRLHVVGWLHKSFRSDNVLFFETDDIAEGRLEQPYVCGFDFSRQDSPTELTENVPTVLSVQAHEIEQALYKHPDLDRRLPVGPAQDDTDEDFAAKRLAALEMAKKFRYRKAYDIYSLGIVLLEIGLWWPITSMYKSSGVQTVADFRPKLAEFVEQLGHRTGRKYCNVVKKCLSGSFLPDDAAPEDSENESTDADKTKMRSTRLWLNNFLHEVVNALEQHL